MIIGVFFLYGNFNAGQEFFTAIESQYGTVEVRAQGNLSIEEQQKITLEVSNIVGEIEGVNQVYAYSNSASFVAFGTDVSRDQISTLLVELYPREERESEEATLYLLKLGSAQNLCRVFM